MGHAVHLLLYSYPPEHVGLNVLGEMKARWDVPVGYSDHSMENNACLAAVTLGATVVEKHLTFSRAGVWLGTPNIPPNPRNSPRW